MSALFITSEIADVMVLWCILMLLFVGIVLVLVAEVLVLVLVIEATVFETSLIKTNIVAAPYARTMTLATLKSHN